MEPIKEVLNDQEKVEKIQEIIKKVNQDLDSIDEEFNIEQEQQWQ